MLRPYGYYWEGEAFRYIGYSFLSIIYLPKCFAPTVLLGGRSISVYRLFVFINKLSAEMLRPYGMIGRAKHFGI